MGTPRMPVGSSQKNTRLSPDVILAAGMEIAAEPGCRAITVRDLGKQLEADPTAIYRHFRNKEELMGALLDQLLRIAIENAHVILEGSDRHDPRRWRRVLSVTAQCILEVYLTYPAIAADGSPVSTTGEAEMVVIELFLQSLSDAGLEGRELVHHYGLFSSYALSYASWITRQTLNGRGADHRYFRLPLKAAPEAQPITAQNSGELASLTLDGVYVAGIELLLDGAEAAGKTARHRHGEGSAADGQAIA